MCIFIELAFYEFFSASLRAEWRICILWCLGFFRVVLRVFIKTAEPLCPVVLQLMSEPGVTTFEELIVRIAIAVCAHVRLKILKDMLLPSSIVGNVLGD